MWIKKTNDEIQAVHRHMQTSPGIPLLLSSVAVVLTVPMSNAPSLPLALGVFLFTFVVTYLSQQWSGGQFWVIFPTTQSRDDPVICVACHEVQHQAPQCTLCSCALEDLALWSWRDDTDASNETAAEEAQPKGPVADPPK